ncbi:hypothetical protein LCGC14_0493120 [marine sediment metagenome]|uniref:Undecaprenyl-diphosphatase n=1 Tax=marine sediment metagenome TaxID=412755 RepID=A0A0F9SPC6_9ZZZZ|nr:MAG: Undecaprenyl-diphosphatase [Candidatus Lokiarchaeum sp. GC14_75]
MIEYIIIAIFQGLFEWLPISSSGQTMIISINLFGISPENAFSLAIWLHLGTMFAVLLKFKNDFIRLFKSLFHSNLEVNIVDVKKRNWLIYATIGTGITAIPIYFIIKIIILDAFTAFQGDILTLVISGFLILTGIILIKMRRIYGTNKISDVSESRVKRDSFLSGLTQGVSILPGISRSGITMSAILLQKYEQNDALLLSFMMSVPVTIASLAVDILFGKGSVFGTLDVVTIIIVTLVSFIIGYLTIDILLRLARNLNFGYFCVLYGVLAYVFILPFLIIA